MTEHQITVVVVAVATMGVIKRGEVNVTIRITVDIPHQRVADIICTAMASCGYWAQVTDTSPLPKGVGYYDRFFNQPTDGWVEFVPVEDMGPGWDIKEGATTMRLDAASIQRGIKIMAEKYSRHYGDFMADNHDAETADVFLQCCLLGEIVYR